MASKKSYKETFRKAGILLCSAVSVLSCLSVGFGKLILQKNIGPKNSITRDKQKILNPKTLVIITPGTNDFGEHWLLKQRFPGAEILNSPELDNRKAIISAIHNHIIKNGAADEIVISSHGSPHMLYPKIGNDNSFLFEDLIVDMQDPEIEGIKKENLPCRCVLGGCNSFANLDPFHADAYLAMAIKYKIDIVGATSVVLGGFQQGLYIKFGSDGTIENDARMSWKYTGWTNQLISNLEGFSRDWIKHVGEIPERSLSEPGKRTTLASTYTQA